MGVSRRSVLVGAAATLVAANSFGRNNEIEDLVAQIRKSLPEGQAGVADTLRRLTSRPGKLIDILGEPQEGGITPLYNDSQITIFNIVWAPLMVLRPHDHNMWATIGVYGGREDNVFWEHTDGTIRPNGADSFGRGDVGSLSSDAIHSVINPMQKLTGAIHVYGGDFYAPGRSQWEGEDLKQRPFDQAGLIRHFKESNNRFQL